MKPDDMTWGHVPTRCDPVVKMDRIRTIWTMVRHPNKPLTAAIYDTTYGRELRVVVGDDVANTIDTLLSRTDDAPLDRRAAVIREVLETQGWRFERSVS